jgi:outer membrane immunogenic protein
MNRTVLVALFSGLAVTSASAADLAARPYTKAPPPAVASVYSWTGFYFGLNAGAVFNPSEFDMTASNFFTAAAQIGADGTTRLDRTGFIGGGQAGYN